MVLGDLIFRSLWGSGFFRPLEKLHSRVERPCIPMLKPARAWKEGGKEGRKEGRRKEGRKELRCFLSIPSCFKNSSMCHQDIYIHISPVFRQFFIVSHRCHAHRFHDVHHLSTLFIVLRFSSCLFRVLLRHLSPLCMSHHVLS